MSTLPKPQTSDLIPLVKINECLHIHFHITDLGLLPDSVYFDDIIKEGEARKFRVPGVSVFTDTPAAMPGLFCGLKEQGFVDVCCSAVWIQKPNGRSDVYKVNFCFVPEGRRDNHLAIHHDTRRAKLGFEQLASIPWNTSVFQNGSGRYDVSCLPALARSDDRLLAVRANHLGLY